MQQLAYTLIQSDANFLFNFAHIISKSEIIDDNAICMLIPYIGLFTCESEKWGRNLIPNMPQFSDEEREYYVSMRSSIKLFDLGYLEYKKIITNKLNTHDQHYIDQLNFDIGHLNIHDNVGIDIYKEEYVGNTLLMGIYLPEDELDVNSELIKKMSEIVGKLIKTYGGNSSDLLITNEIYEGTVKDINHFKNYIFLDNKIETLCYFSIACGIKFITVFIEGFFLGECPQKFKYAYLQYYYLTELVDEIAEIDGINFQIDKSYRNRKFRNCLAHYGLGQYMEVFDIQSDKLYGGIIEKTFDKDYYEMKKIIYTELNNLVDQIEDIILRK